MFKALGAVAAVLGICGLVAGGLYFYGHADAVRDATELTHVRDSPAFRSAEHSLSLDPPLNALLGGNFKFGDVVVKSGGLDDRDDGPVMLDIAVTGSNGGGHAQVKIDHHGRGSGWLYQGGDFFPTSGPPLHLAAR